MDLHLIPNSLYSEILAATGIWSIHEVRAPRMVKSTVQQRGGRDYLWLVLFLIIFFNGFESGGYQASLWSIGQEYDLSTTSMGIFAAVELLADMLAPLLLGAWADRVGKKRSMTVALVVQLIATGIVWLIPARPLFVTGMFVLGLTTSALQCIAIAALADAYPVSGKEKIGYITSMYAFGAVVSPLAVSFYLDIGLGWRTLFVLLAVGSLAALLGIRHTGTDAREKAPRLRDRTTKGTFVLWGILLLCLIMLIYVGFENGFAFFVDTMFTDVFHASTGKLALSLYWAVMIPSRILVGRFSKHASNILIGAIIAIPCFTVLFSLSADSVVALILYPSVLNIMLSFAGKRTATATGMITTATGIGGFALTALTGFMSDQWGMRTAMMVLAGFFVFSLASAIIIRRKVA